MHINVNEELLSGQRVRFLQRKDMSFELPGLTEKEAKAKGRKLLEERYGLDYLIVAIGISSGRTIHVVVRKREKPPIERLRGQVYRAPPPMSIRQPGVNPLPDVGSKGRP